MLSPRNLGYSDIRLACMSLEDSVLVREHAVEVSKMIEIV